MFLVIPPPPEEEKACLGVLECFGEGKLWEAVKLVAGETERPLELSHYRTYLLAMLVMEARLHRLTLPLLDLLAGSDWLDPILLKLGRAAEIPDTSASNHFPQVRVRRLLMEAHQGLPFRWDEYEAEVKPALTVSDRMQVACELAAYCEDLKEAELVECLQESGRLNGRAAAWLIAVVAHRTNLDYLLDDCRALRQRFAEHPELIFTWFAEGWIDASDEEIMAAVSTAKIHFGLLQKTRPYFLKRLKPRKAVWCFKECFKPILQTDLYCQGKGSLTY